MAPQQLSPSLHEALVARHFARDVITKEIIPDPVLTLLHDAMQSGRQSADKALRVANANLKNAMRTPAANHRQARTLSFGAIDGSLKRFDAAIAAAQKEISTIETKISGPPRSKDVVAEMSAMELRSVLAQMDPAKRNATIAGALATGNEVIVNAVLTAQPLLSGLSANEHAMKLSEWRKRFHGPDQDRVQRLKLALSDVMSAAPRLVSYVDGLTDAKLVAAAELTEKEAADANEAAGATS